MKQSGAMAFVQVCALGFLVAFHLIGLSIRLDQESVNYTAQVGFQVKSKSELI